MELPTPEVGMVLRYRYLWRREAVKGVREGAKERPCVVILAVEQIGQSIRVLVAPITHSASTAETKALALPATTKRALGLDGEKSWVVLDEVNAFYWPGHDLAPIGKKPPQSPVYGMLSPKLFAQVRAGVLQASAAITKR